MQQRFLSSFIFLCAFGLLMLSVVPAEATTYSELETLYDTQLVHESPAVINGDSVEVFSSSPGFVEVFVNGSPVATISDDRQTILSYLATTFNIPLTSAGSIAVPASAAAAVSNLIFNNLVVPTVPTQQTQEKQAQQKAKQKVRAFGSSLQAEWVDVAGEDGNIYGLNLGYATDIDDYTFGVMVPYDRMNFDSFDADRIGAILFGQYHRSISDDLNMSVTTNLNYMYTAYEYDSGTDDEVNTVGIGLSTSLNYIQENYELGGGVSWQYNQDDVDVADDEQHLLKLGGNCGFHINQQSVVNLSVTWNYDVTDYTNDYGDDNYFELGTEYQADFTDTWALNIGYRKVVALKNYESDLVYLGSIWQF